MHINSPFIIIIIIIIINDSIGKQLHNSFNTIAINVKYIDRKEDTHVIHIHYNDNLKFTFLVHPFYMLSLFDQCLGEWRKRFLNYMTDMVTP